MEQTGAAPVGAAGGTDARLSAFAVFAGLTGLIVGLVVLGGWAFDVDTLKGIAFDWPTIKANTAICLALLGGALLLLRPADATVPRRRAGIVVALAAVSIGALTLAQYAFGWDLGIDQLLFDDPSASAYPGRMAIPAAVAFVLLGAALAALDVRPPDRYPAQIVALLTGLLALTILIGYLFDVPFADELDGLVTVALNTALALLLMSAGVLAARPEGWFVGVVFDPGPGGIVARRLLPIGIAVPIAVGGLALIGRRLDGYGEEFGLAILVGMSVGVIGAAVLVISHRIHEAEHRRVEAERTLSETRGRTRAVFDTALDAILTMDHEGLIVDANPAVQRIFGHQRDELIGRPLADAIIPPALRDQHRAGLKRYVETGEQRVLGRRLELSAIRANGEGFPVEVSILRVDAPGPPLFMGIIRDISEQVQTQAELTRAHQALAERAAELERRVEERTRHLAEVNAELEAFAYSVSHDLRAPLRAMDGFSRILLEEVGEGGTAEVRGAADRIHDGARRMGQLIDDLLDFSRLGRTELRKRRVDTAGVVADVLAEVRSDHDGRAVDVVVRDLPWCDADPVLLRQVFTNLIDNGFKFTRGREDARIEVGSRLGEGGRVVYFVGDNGVGFDMAYADKIFGVFQRLHRREEFEGTGVGLAIVQRIVHRHGGRIWVEAEPDRGATFSFTIGEESPGGGAV